MDGLNHRIIPSTRLEIVSRPENVPATSCKLMLGDPVMLNSGGSEMLVVEIEGDQITAGTPDGLEHCFDRVCLSKISN